MIACTPGRIMRASSVMWVASSSRSSRWMSSGLPPGRTTRRPTSAKRRPCSIARGGSLSIRLDRGQCPIAFLHGRWLEERHRIAAREAVLDGIVEGRLDLSLHAAQRRGLRLHIGLPDWSKANAPDLPRFRASRRNGQSPGCPITRMPLRPDADAAKFAYGPASVDPGAFASGRTFRSRSPPRQWSSTRRSSPLRDLVVQFETRSGVQLLGPPESGGR